MFRSIFTFLIFSFAFSIHAATSPQQFTADADALLKQYVKQGRVDYVGLKSSGAIEPLVADIAAVDLATLSGNVRKAYLINAYNLLVIKQALDNYPLASVLDVKGFFDGTKQTVGGRRLTLNQLEKDLLLKEFNDARLHFVLVCGATGCPPITNFAYAPAKLEAQLDRQTKAAVNDPTFIRTGGAGVQLSKIFEWYAKDFGGSKASVLGFINRYRTEALPTDARVSYYEYDWSLNRSGGRAATERAADPADAMAKAALAAPGDASNRGERDPAEPTFGALGTTGGANNAARYVVSSTIRRGSAEIKIFNNLYSQEAAGERSSFFTTSISALYGVTDRFNFGFDLRYRRVRYDEAGAASNFAVLSEGGDFSRSAVSGFGPKVRIAPFGKLPNFSVQSALWIPLAGELEGGVDGSRFTDWNNATWFTQVFNDFPIGSNFSLFTEVDVVWEDIGSAAEGAANRFSTPVTAILSYFPTPKATLYGLASYSPFWMTEFDYFYQLGAGAKYQFTPRFEVELLATAFDNSFLNQVNGNAGTVNLGVRFNL